MEKILIIGCRNTMDDVCIGCSRCLVAFNRREGQFARYAGKEAEVLGILNCGGCPGASIVQRLAQVKLWNVPLKEQPTVIHIGPCLSDHCTHADDVITKIQAKSGLEVVEGTHPYMPEKIWG